VNVVVLDDYQNAVHRLVDAERVRRHRVTVYTDHTASADVIVERCRDAECLVLIQQRLNFPADVIDRLPRLKLISQTGRPTSHIDVAACTRRGILVCTGGGGNASAPAELTWALILASLRSIPAEVESLKSGRWETDAVGVGLSGKTLGIYAYGKIGSIVASVGRAFGMRVICWGREGSTARARQAGFEIAPSREVFFESCDVLSLHLPLNNQTRGIVTPQDLARMKPSSLLVNTSRAGLVGDDSLAEAVKSGRPGRAAVDVFDDEPATPSHNPLLRLDNVLATPHIGYVEEETLMAYLTAAFDQIDAFEKGDPINIVNPEALKRN
jgi:D-3-phosphoglycerate dehydrogenase